MPAGAEGKNPEEAGRTAAEWVAEGERLRRQERNTSAMAAYDQALRMEPGHAGAWLAKALLLEDLERTEEALAAYDRLLEGQPRHVAGWSNRAGLLLRAGRLEEALASLDAALAADPAGDTNALLCLNKGLLLWQGFERPAEALPWLERALPAGFPEAAEAIAACRAALGPQR